MVKGNFVKLRDFEVMEAQLRNQESALLIPGIRNNANDDASDQEKGTMQLAPLIFKEQIFSCIKKSFLYRKKEFVANVVSAPVDNVGDQKRMLLLPGEVGEEDFLESRFPTLRIEWSNKRLAGGPLLEPGWKQKADSFSGCKMAI
ncbi:hypothetical protein TNCV_782771 [Trichonephila clavipes]|nr:hypothetical protein TNCV_782771 [Trichonephila clavipes]